MSHAPVARRLTALLPLLIAGGYIATTVEVSEAADAGVYRSGDFDRADTDMTSCPAAVLSKRHPELQFAIGVAPGGAFSLSGSRSRSASAVIWTIVAKSTGSKSSHVELRNKGAEPSELKEVWQVVEACEKQ